jgi:hypothetical protein
MTMKNNAKKRLTLEKMTIAVLSPDALAGVVGGRPADTASACAKQCCSGASCGNMCA